MLPYILPYNHTYIILLPYLIQCYLCPSTTMYTHIYIYTHMHMHTIYIYIYTHNIYIYKYMFMYTHAIVYASLDIHRCPMVPLGFPYCTHCFLASFQWHLGLVMDVNTPKDGIEIHKIPWDTIIYIYIYICLYSVYCIYCICIYNI